MSPPSLRIIGYNGQIRDAPEPQRGFPLASFLPKNKDKIIYVTKKKPKSPTNSTQGREIRALLLQNEDQQRMAEGCAQKKQLLSHQGSSKVLPGGFPINDRFEGNSGNPEENQWLEPTNCDGRKSPSTTRSSPIQGRILETPESQREEYPFKTPKEYREEHSMAQSNLQGNGTPWEIPSRNLSTPGKRENQPSTPLHGRRPLNICNSSTRSSYSDSKYSQITSKKSELLSSDYSTPQIPHENIPIDISLRRSVNMFTENMNFLVLHTLKNNRGYQI
jgi:hypothetical protein